MSENSGSGRRRWLVAGVAVAAGAAGAWVATRRTTGSEAATQPAPKDPVDAFWGLSFEMPAGGTLTMASLQGKPLLLNFWATWCKPCVREMPEIDRFYRDHAAKGWQVVGLAIDSPTPVREFLTKVPVGFPIGLAGLEGTELVRQLGNERGGLPFSLAFDRQARVAHRKLGETSYAELAGWAREIG